MTYWDQDAGREEDDGDRSDAPDGASIYVNGSYIKVDVGSSFIDGMKSTARDAGLGKFRVLVDGAEIEPENAPEVFSEGMGVEIRPYDVAGV